LEDVVMAFPLSSSIVKSQIKASSLNANALLGSLALLLVFAILIYLASRSPGMSPEELASLLTAFP
jgi:hypothetical protein